MGAEDEIAVAVQPAVQAAGLEIWDVERSGTSVRILVDGPGGVDLDTISDLSRAVSAILDERDDLAPGGHYTLEVSSPGLERRLRQPAHFSRYLGEEVAVKIAAPVNGSRRLRGTLVGVADDAVTIRSAVSKAETLDVRLPLTSIERANAVFNWGPAPKPSHAGKPAKGAGANTPAPNPAEASEEAR